MPVRTVTTYDEWTEVSRAFADGAFEVLLACGSAGLSKSYTMRQVLGGRAHWITGNASPFQFYCDGWPLSVEHRQQAEAEGGTGLLVIDDCDQLLGDRAGLNLMKAFCQTDEEKLIGWNTASKQLEQRGIPRQYHFDGRVCVISNDYHALTKHLKAVLDRGLLILCKFPAAEVHRNVESWWPHVATGKNGFDAEVFDFIGSHLHLIAGPSMRNYIVGAQAKRAGLDWKAILFETFGLSEEYTAVARIMDGPLSGEDRVRAFHDATGMSRATFFRIKGEVEALKSGRPIKEGKQRNRGLSVIS